MIPARAAVNPTVAPAAAEAIPELAGRPGAGAQAAGPTEPRFPRGEPAPRRKSFVDLTASPCFAHAPDYTWLQGQVEYSRLSKGWRLRYASVDEEDAYGGCVTLIDDGHFAGLKDGQYVCVRGRLSNPGGKGDSPAYRVESLAPVANRNSIEQSAGQK
jgi:hypothetical protein